MNWFDLSLILGSLVGYMLIIASFGYLVFFVRLDSLDMPPVLLVGGVATFIVTIVVTAQEALQ